MTLPHVVECADPPAATGLFVCVEGIDGAGKTTAAHNSVSVLQSRGIPAVVFDKKTTVFGSAYVQRHTRQLRTLIWDHPADDPYLELGDMHWVHLQAAWYMAVAQCAIAPLLNDGRIVVTDTWTYKFLAKLALRPEVDIDAAATVFDALPQPDLVIRLQLDPVSAAARKSAFGISETGNHEGDVALTEDGFAAYQQRLGEVLDAWTTQRGWTVLDVNGLSPQEVAAAVADRVAAAVADRVVSAFGDRLPQPVPVPVPVSSACWRS